MKTKKDKRALRKRNKGSLSSTTPNKENILLEEIRYPRLNGLTYECKELNNIPKNTKEYTDKKNSIYKRIIWYYVGNGFRILGLGISLSELGILLEESTNKITRDVFAGEMELIGNSLDPEEIKKQASALLGIGLNWALSDRAAIVAQSQLLQASQGSEYVPFLSAEYSRNLKNQIDSTKTILDIHKSLLSQMPSQNQINILNQTIRSDSESNYISHEEAFGLISEKMGQPLLPGNVDLVIAAHAEEGLPRVSPISSARPVESSLAKPKPKSLRDLQNEVDNHLARREDHNETIITPGA